MACSRCSKNVVGPAKPATNNTATTSRLPAPAVRTTPKPAPLYKPTKR